MDLLLHLNTKNDKLKKKNVFILLFKKKYARDFPGILQSAQLIILLYYCKTRIKMWKLMCQRKFRRISEEPEELQYHFTVFYDFGKFDCTQHLEYCYTLSVTILVICNGKHISHKIIKRDEE